MVCLHCIFLPSRLGTDEQAAAAAAGTAVGCVQEAGVVSLRLVGSEQQQRVLSWPVLLSPLALHLFTFTIPFRPYIWEGFIAPTGLTHAAHTFAGAGVHPICTRLKRSVLAPTPAYLLCVCRPPHGRDSWRP